MKKCFTLGLVLLAALAANAQGTLQSYYDRELYRSIVDAIGVLSGIFLFTTFFLSIIRLVLDHRIKRKMIEKSVPETVVEQFLQPTTPRDNKSQAIKWFLVTASIGVGLFLVNFTAPLGIQSIAIMALSVSAGFLGYYLFIKRSESEK